MCFDMPVDPTQKVNLMVGRRKKGFIVMTSGCSCSTGLRFKSRLFKKTKHKPTHGKCFF